MLFDTLIKIDLSLLEDQKQSLVNVIHSLHEDDDTKEHLEGILSLLDCIQDEIKEV